MFKKLILEKMEKLRFQTLNLINSKITDSAENRLDTSIDKTIQSVSNSGKIGKISDIDGCNKCFSKFI